MNPLEHAPVSRLGPQIIDSANEAAFHAFLDLLRLALPVPLVVTIDDLGWCIRFARIIQTPELEV